MTDAETLFFQPMPQVLPLYVALAEKMAAEFPNAAVKVAKTQITWKDRYGFAFASLPMGRRRGWPAVCLVVSFGTGERVESPRILAASEPYPGRWTHHVAVEAPEDIDGELMSWLREAHAFALVKGRGR